MSKSYFELAKAVSILGQALLRRKGVNILDEIDERNSRALRKAMDSVTNVGHRYAKSPKSAQL
jgi:hypothetical protein